jgi:hydroxymethylbilane synthase
MRLRIGTRASALAQWQAQWVAEQLRSLGVEAEVVLISTSGDRKQDSIGTLGVTGVFTKEIQRALLDGRIDLTVHSLKDLPTDVTPGLGLAAVPRRAPVWDTLICRKRVSLDDLPPGAVVGTGSLRRRAQLLNARPDLKMADLRGNVDTRLRKLRDEDLDAIVLAQAGLERLGFAAQITQILPANILLPAVGQGALGLEIRSDDQAAREVVGQLDDPASHAGVAAERAMLAALRGGCLAPVGAWGRFEEDHLTLTGRVLSGDGREKIEAVDSAPVSEAEALGRRVAEVLLAQGAGELIRSSREWA